MSQGVVIYRRHSHVKPPESSTAGGRETVYAKIGLAWYAKTHFHTERSANMCVFEMRLILCGCEDPECRQREPQLVGVLAENGHPLKINWYYRRGRMCTGYFPNRDPNRLVVRLGLAADNTNSTMDCTNKVIRVEGDPERSTLRCAACWKMCRI